MMLRRLFAVALLMGVAQPVFAQDIANRIFQMEERIRQLTGQVEELNFTVQQLQKQLGQKRADVGEPEAFVPAAPSRKIVQKPAPEVELSDGGIETIEEQPAPFQVKQKAEIVGGETIEDLTAGGNAAAQTGDGGFQGEVLVPSAAEQQAAAAPQPGDGVAQPDGIETVSLQPDDSPDALYKTANEALLRRQFPEAEAGFRTFLERHSDHSLAGSAQYWLGETFYVQGDSRQAAQQFLQAYKKYPKSRRAPDSLLKLGMSLNKMGQKDQACAALNSVSTEFPRAVEAKKRAVAEYKRAGC